MQSLHDRSPEVIERWTAPDGTPLALRPVMADDAGRELEFFSGLSPQTRYERLFSHRGLLPGELQRLVRFDVRREIALMVAADDGAARRTVAVARLHRARAADGACEFGLVVGDAWQRRGVGGRLLLRLLEEAARAGVRRVVGHTRASNEGMKKLARKLGFRVQADPEDAGVALLTLQLGPT
jgi:acetyltransferase